MPYRLKVLHHTQINPSKARIYHNGPVEVGTVEVSMEEVGTVEVGIGEDGISEVGIAEVGTVEVGSFEIGIVEVGSFEIGIVEFGIAKDGSFEVGISEAGIAEVGTVEVGAYIRLLFSPLIPYPHTLFENSEMLLVCHLALLSCFPCFGICAIDNYPCTCRTHCSSRLHCDKYKDIQ